MSCQSGAGSMGLKQFCQGYLRIQDGNVLKHANACMGNGKNLQGKPAIDLGPKPCLLATGKKIHLWFYVKKFSYLYEQGNFITF